MKISKVFKGIYLTLVLSLFAFGAGCGSDENPQAAETAAKSAAKSPVVAEQTIWPNGDVDHTQAAPVPEDGTPLKILQFLPNGHDSKLSQIVVMFNQPMVALGAYDEVDRSVLVLDPPLNGQLRWLNQYCLAFTPEQPIFGSLALKATLKGEITSLSGNTLGQDHEINVTLPNVNVINANSGRPLINYENPLRPVWTVTFNQKLNLDRLKELAFFEDHGDSGQEYQVPIEAEAVEEDQPSFGYMEVRVWPKANLPVNSHYALNIHPGAVSAAGPEPLEDDLTVFTGYTYGRFRFNLGGPSENNGELFQEFPDDYLELDFNNPVSLAEAVKYIEFNPKVPEFESLKAQALRAAQKPAQGVGATDGAAAGETDGTLLADAEDGGLSGSSPSSGQAPEDEDGDGEAGDGEDGKKDDLTTEIFFRPALKANTTYVVTVKAGLTDGFGQVTKTDQSISFKTGAYRPSVQLDQWGGTLERKTSPVLPIKVANTQSFRVEGYALTLDEARALFTLSRVNLGYGYISEAEKGLNYLSNLKKPKVLEFKPPKGAVDGPINMGLNLATMFGQDLTNHVLVVTIPSRQYKSFSVFQVTDLGLTVKIGRDSGLAWTTDLTTGLGREGIEVEIISLQGTSLWKGFSGPEGLVELPGGEEINQIIKDLVLDAENELGNASLSLYVVAKDHTPGQEQMTLWNLAWNQGFDTYDISLDGSETWPLGPNLPNGYLLTSQPIYKPGETVNLKIIGREQDGDKLVNLPQGKIKLVLSDQDLNIVAERTVEVSALGTASLNYQLPAQPPLGTYNVFLAKDVSAPVGPSSPHPYLFSNPNLTYYGSFLVENFRAPAFDITFEDLPKEVYAGQKLEVKAKALYHFGGPVANRPAEYSFTSEDLDSFSLQKLPDFSLVNNMSPIDDVDTYQSPVTTILSGDQNLDNDGKLTFTLNVDPTDKPKPRLLTVHLGAQDVDSRSVFKNASLTAHPASIYAALKTREMVGRAGQPLTFDYAVAKPDGTLVKNDLTVTLYQRNWNTVRRRSSGGVYLYDSKPFDEKVQELTLASEENATSEFQLIPPKPGYYWVKASLRDENGLANESSVSFYVSGEGPVGWYFSNDDRLTMIADKTQYAPGDTAKILVQSPFNQGEALVTVERSGIRKSQVVPIYSQSPIFEIPLGPEDGPNVFVSVILSRGRIAEVPDKNNVDLGKPSIKKGYLTLRIPNRSDILKVDLKTDAETYKPGEEVTVDLKVALADGAAPGETEIALAVVDTALVQLVGDEVYFPEKTFSAERPLSMLTVNPIISLIGRRNLLLKGANEAGGGALMDAAAPIAQAENLRQNFKNMAFFQPDVPVAPDGTAKVSFTLPDNLTTFKIYAVATGHGRLSGTGVGELLVTKDVLLRNSLPNYASVGDEFVAAVTVTNRTDKPGSAKVSLSATNIDILDSPSEKEVQLDAGQSLEVGFPVKATHLGQSDFTFAVSMGQDSDSALYRINILPINPLATQASYLQLTAGTQAVDLKLQEDIDPSRGQLTLELAPSLVGLLSGPLEYLKAYPLSCLEQLTSKAYGALFSLRLQRRLNLSPEEIATAKVQVETHIKLLDQSNLGGGFTFWPSITDWEDRYPALAAFALEFLLDAREADFQVDDTLIVSICDYLTNYLNDPKAQAKAWYNQETLISLSAYSVMTLAKAGREVHSYVEVLNANKEKLPLIDLVSLIRALGYMPAFTGRSQLLKESITLLQNNFHVSAGQTQISGTQRSPWLWSDNDKITAMALLALTETAAHNEFIPGLVRNLIAKASKGSYSSTQSNVYALMALSNYIEKNEDELPRINVTANLDAEAFLTAAFTSPINPSVKATSSLSQLANVQALNLATEGTGTAWATVRLSSAPAKADLSADISNGLILSRSYEVIRPQIQNSSQTVFKRGQVVKVTVTMMTPEHRHDLVLEDKIPAGFEAINLTYLSEDQTLIPQFNPEISGWKYNDFFWFYHQEIWPEKVSVFADYLPAGVYTISYLVRPITIGTYQVPGPKAEEMYAPEVHGRGLGQTLTIVPDDAQ
jgi:uncharacterized protein YfaS (alpha-2-macroglobulin family)